MTLRSRAMSAILEDSYQGTTQPVPSGRGERSEKGPTSFDDNNFHSAEGPRRRSRSAKIKCKG